MDALVLRFVLVVFTTYCTRCSLYVLQDQLRSAPMPQERVERDDALPMLGRKILSQHR